jgi:hypothetical protein
MHAPTQSRVPAGQRHEPPRQFCPALQPTPHAPQLRSSDPRSRHAPLQFVSPVAQPPAHEPAEQTDPAAHAAPHFPQFFGLEAGSTQVPSQSIVPCGQTHAPKLQVRASQSFPHAPQSRSSLARSTQASPQSVRPAAQLAAQRPRLQTCPGAQTAPHLPQFAGSEATSTQRAAHSVSSARQTKALVEPSAASLPVSALPASALDASGDAPLSSSKSIRDVRPHASSKATMTRLKTRRTSIKEGYRINECQLRGLARRADEVAYLRTPSWRRCAPRMSASTTREDVARSPGF